MSYAIQTPTQLKAVLRALRKARGLSQARVGQMIGVTQQRLAQIEARPEVATFDTIARLIALLNARLVVEDIQPGMEEDPGRRRTKPRRGRGNVEASEDW